MLDLIIVGGGLSGLALAKFAQAENMDFLLLEGRERFGGRILSVAASDNSATRLDLGPCWVWPSDQPRIASLLKQHKILCHPHWHKGHNVYMTELESQPQLYSDGAGYLGAYRIDQGIYLLVESYLASINFANLKLNHSVESVINHNDHVEVLAQTSAGVQSIKARQIAICLAPRVVVNNIKFFPELDPKLSQAMADIPTWMASHAKIVVQYKQAFWREKGLSGNGIAAYPGAALSEIVDLCSMDSNIAAVGGFSGMHPDLRDRWQENLPDLIIDQLSRMFGSQASDILKVYIQDWSREKFTSCEQDRDAMKEHPAYGHPWLQLDHWNDKLYFGGTETANEYGGYLEGAILSAERIARFIKLTSEVDRTNLGP